MSEETDAVQGHGADGSPGDAALRKPKKVDRETAKNEFFRWCEENELDCDIDAMTDGDKAGFKPIMDRFIKACMMGRVEADGVILKYTLSAFSEPGYAGKIITIKRPDGHAFIGMDGYKDTQSVHRINGFLSALTGPEIVFFTKIDGNDWLFFRDIATLFLAG
jgi:hypothetical protein